MTRQCKWVAMVCVVIPTIMMNEGNANLIHQSLLFALSRCPDMSAVVADWASEGPDGTSSSALQNPKKL